MAIQASMLSSSGQVLFIPGLSVLSVHKGQLEVNKCVQAMTCGICNLFIGDAQLLQFPVAWTVAYPSCPRLLFGTKAPVMTPNGIDFSLLSFLLIMPLPVPLLEALTLDNICNHVVGEHKVNRSWWLTAAVLLLCCGGGSFMAAPQSYLPPSAAKLQTAISGRLHWMDNGAVACFIMHNGPMGKSGQHVVV